MQSPREKYPTDLMIRFELGELFFKAGKISEAIQEFQKAQNNPARRIQAMRYLGQCFSQRGMNDLAAANSRTPSKRSRASTTRKGTRLPTRCRPRKDGQEGRGHRAVQSIYEEDISYKDVAAKVDAYYSSNQ